MSGSGTLGDPYVILTYADLVSIEDDMTAYYVLGADIDAVGLNHIPIGRAAYETFLGQLDGKDPVTFIDHTISNLTINLTCIESYDYVGLFYSLGEYPGVPGNIINLKLRDIAFTIDVDDYEWPYIGSLAGYINSATLSNVSVTGSMVITHLNGGDVGGLAGDIGGYVATGSLADCWTDIDISVTYSLIPDYAGGVGGIAGYLSLGMSDCYTLGDIFVDASWWESLYVGGLAGCDIDVAISGVNATGTITIINAYDVYVGGLFGEMDTSWLMLSDSWSSVGISVVLADDAGYFGEAGGLVGDFYRTDMLRCFSLGSIDVSGGDPTSGYGVVGGLTGYLQGANEISFCFALGTIDVHDNYGYACGGCFGYVDWCPWVGIGVHDCYARVDIDNLDPDWNGETGGLFGGVFNSTVFDCYATGDVSSDPLAGGFQGFAGSNVLTGCYWDVETSGVTTDQGDPGSQAEGKTTAEMTTQSTFVDWDFFSTWGVVPLCNDGYPCLQVLTPGCTPVVGAAVQTNAATNLGFYTATLNGEVLSLGLDPSLDVSFVYGEVSPGPYPYETTPQAVAGLIPFDADIASLDPGTTYYFRAKGVGALSGTVYGLEGSFVAVALPEVTTNYIGSITNYSCEAVGILDSLGLDVSLDVTFEYGEDMGGPYPYETGAQTIYWPGSGFIWNIGILPPYLDRNTTYYIRAKAVGAITGTIYGAELTFTTLDSSGAVQTDPATGGFTLVTTFAGQTGTGDTTSLQGGLPVYGKFVATADGLVTHVGVRSLVAGAVKVGVYLSDGGSPEKPTGTPLAVQNHADIVAVGWNYVELDTPFTAVLGTTYFIGGISNNNGCIRYKAGPANDSAWYTVVSFTAFSFTTNPTILSLGAYTPYLTLCYCVVASIKNTTVCLHGTVLDLGLDSYLQCCFDYGLVSGGPYPFSIAPGYQYLQSFHMNAVSLIPNSTYFFRVRAFGNVVGYIYGAELSFTTANIFAVIQTDLASNVWQYNSRLNGQVDSFGFDDTLVVNFEYGKVSGGPYTSTVVQTMTVVGGCYALLTGLDDDTEYFFRVKAVGTQSGTLYGAEVSFWTMDGITYGVELNFTRTTRRELSFTTLGPLTGIVNPVYLVRQPRVL